MHPRSKSPRARFAAASRARSLPGAKCVSCHLKASDASRGETPEIRSWRNGGFADDAGSADPWQLFAGQPIDDASAAEARGHLYETLVVLDRGADNRRLAPQSMGAHGREQGIGALGRYDRDQFALVGDEQRIEPQQFAGCRYLGLHRDRVFIDAEPDSRLL